MGKDKNKFKSQDAPHLRENYEDHSLKFLDWTEHLGIEKVWIGRLFVFLEEKFHIRQLLVLFTSLWLLAYALTFEIPITANFQVGEVAKHDFVSPLSFEMTDQVTTEEKKIKAEASIPAIFDYDALVFERVSSSVYRSFRVMRNIVKNTNWPKNYVEREEKIKEFFNHKGEFEKEIGANIPDYIFEWLVQNRFAARFENIVIRNLNTWYQNKIADGLDKTVPASQSVILAKFLDNTNHGKEFNLNKKDILEVTSTDSFPLSDVNTTPKLSNSDISNLSSLAHHLIYPNLTLNKQEMATRKKAARDTVLPITISIKKNQIIIPEGTVIQPFHLNLVREIQKLKSDRRHDLIIFAIAIALFTLVIVSYQYLARLNKTKAVIQDKDLVVMSLVTLGVIIVAKFFMFITETAFVAKFGAWFPSAVFLFAAPVAAAPMLIGLVIEAGELVWLYTAFIAITMGIMMELHFTFMIVTLTGGMAAVQGVYNCKKRNDVYWAGVRTGLVNAVMIGLLLTVMKIDQEGFTRELLISIPAGFVGGLLSSFLAMTVIPLIESAFNYTTDVKLLELSNLNHPLLKQMIVNAPGTYHHSMLVGSMVEAAAEEIGANPLLAKVMCYYHDIGKMEHSNYFIENQKPGQNPHDHISPYMSKTLLIAHVKDGVELGIKYKLGKPIIDGIIQHHGTTLISYFYNKAIDLKVDGDVDVPENEFKYPGPRPQFREAALCMLADSIEAASRSLDEPTPVRLQNIVRNIVQRKFMEGQLDECSLTLKDLSKVEYSFSRILLGIYHQRIDYPKSAGGGASEAPPTTSLFSVS